MITRVLLLVCLKLWKHGSVWPHVSGFHSCQGLSVDTQSTGQPLKEAKHFICIRLQRGRAALRDWTGKGSGLRAGGWKTFTELGLHFHHLRREREVCHLRQGWQSPAGTTPGNWHHPYRSPAPWPTYGSIKIASPRQGICMADYPELLIVMAYLKVY